MQLNRIMEGRGDARWKYISQPMPSLAELGPTKTFLHRSRFDACLVTCHRCDSFQIWRLGIPSILYSSHQKYIIFCLLNSKGCCRKGNSFPTRHLLIFVETMVICLFQMFKTTAVFQKAQWWDQGQLQTCKHYHCARYTADSIYDHQLIGKK